MSLNVFRAFLRAMSQNIHLCDFLENATDQSILMFVRGKIDNDFTKASDVETYTELLNAVCELCQRIDAAINYMHMHLTKTS